MKILVTGENGQLGSEINKISPKYNYNWVFTGHDNFDLSDLKNINASLDTINPNLIINCAAFTSVNNAEDDFESANILNHKSVKFIAKWCNYNNCKYSLHFIWNIPSYRLHEKPKDLKTT